MSFAFPLGWDSFNKALQIPPKDKLSHEIHLSKKKKNETIKDYTSESSVFLDVNYIFENFRGLGNTLWLCTTTIIIKMLRVEVNWIFKFLGLNCRQHPKLQEKATIRPKIMWCNYLQSERTHDNTKKKITFLARLKSKNFGFSSWTVFNYPFG